MKNDKHNILVFGVGNEILTDDGIGPKLVNQLKNESLFEHITFETALMGGLDLLDYIKGYETAIFIDAIRTKNGIPGDVYFLNLSDFKETLHLSNIHDISFISAIQLGEKLGLEIPKQIHIIAIEIVEDLIFSNSLSPILESRYNEIYSKVNDKLLTYLKIKYSSVKQ